MGLKQRITRELLKERIGCTNIFNYYYGDFEIGKVYKSFFRQEDNPSAGFYISEHGSVVYHDFVTGDKFDFIKFVMKVLNLTYSQALKQIATDFDIILGEKSSEKIAVIKAVQVPKPKPIKVFNIVKRKYYTKKDLDYWKKFNITKEELKANDIYSVQSVEINGWQLPYSDLRFAYLIKDGEGKQYVKIYTPLEKEGYKWLTNAPLNIPFGLNELPLQSKTLHIIKGRKDQIIFKKYFTDTIATQNESKSCLKKETIKALKKCYNEIYIWFDLDRPGIVAANYYKSYGFIPMFVGYNKRFSIWQNLKKAKENKTKDPADFVYKYGLDVFEQYLKYLKLI